MTLAWKVARFAASLVMNPDQQVVPAVDLLYLPKEMPPWRATVQHAYMTSDSRRMAGIGEDNSQGGPGLGTTPEDAFDDLVRKRRDYLRDRALHWAKSSEELGASAAAVDALIIELRIPVKP